MKEKKGCLPDQCIDRPKGNDDRIFQHSYHKLNSESSEEVCKAYKFRSISLAPAYHFRESLLLHA